MKKKELENSYKKILLANFDLNYTLDTKGNVIEAFSSKRIVYGYKIHEIIGTNFKKYLHTTEILKNINNLKKVLIGKNVRYETKLIKKDGTEAEVEAWATAIKSKGKIIGIQGNFRDISIRKRYEKSLNESSNKFKEFFQNINSGAIIYLPTKNNYIIVDINKTGASISEVNKKEIVGKTITEVFPGVKKMGLFKILNKVNKNGKSLFYPSALYNEGKLNKWFDNFVFKLPTGEIVAIYQDRTKEKHNEQVIYESEKKYKEIFEMSPEAIIIFDNKGKLIDLNNRVYDWLGYAREEVIGVNLLKLPFLSARSKIIVAKKFTQRMLGKEVLPYELEYINKNGKRIIGLIKATPIRDDKGHIIQDLVMISDVTKQKESEAAIKNLATIVETSNIIIISINLNREIVSWNKGAVSAYGYTEKEALGKKISIIIPREKQGELDSIIKKTNIKVNRIETERITKSGKVKNISLTISLIKDDKGKVLGYSSIGRDITEKIKNEKKVKDLAFRNKLFVDSFGEIVYEYDLKANVIEWNGVEKVLGYKNEEIGDTIEEYIKRINPNDVLLFEEEYKRALKNKSFYEAEYRIKNKQGEYVWLYDYGACIFGKDKKLEKIVGIAKNITNKKDYEKNVVLNEKRLNKIQEIAHLGSWEYDLGSKKCIWSNELYKIFGLDKKKIKPSIEKILDIIHKQDKKKTSLAIRNAINMKLGFNIEVKILKPGGFEIWVQATGNLLTNDEDEPIKLVGSFLNITNRKEKELEIEKTGEKYEELYNSLMDGVLFVDMDGKVVECNSAYEKITKYNIEELRQKTYEDLTPKKWHKMELDIVKNQIIKKGYSGEYEKEYIRKDKKIVKVSIKAWLMKDDGGKPSGMWALVRDVTEKREKEEELREQNEELQKLNQLMTGRELKMIELKKELRNLQNKKNKNNN